MTCYLLLYVESSLKTLDVPDILFWVAEKVDNKHYKGKNKENRINVELSTGKATVFFTVLGCGLVWIRMTQNRLYALIQVTERHLHIARTHRRGRVIQSLRGRIDGNGNLINTEEPLEELLNTIGIRHDEELRQPEIHDLWADAEDQPDEAIDHEEITELTFGAISRQRSQERRRLSNLDNLVRGIGT